MATQLPALIIHRADSFATRLLGLRARPRLSAREALYLAPCSSIHTVGMRYRIDVAFVDRRGCVIKLVEALKPMRAAWCPSAHGAVELLAGSARAYGIGKGSVLAVGMSGGVPA